MSRIRSIHPGLWTDEAFVSLSPMARLFLMGLWNECDDMGSFAWSPLGLKMKILPADNVNAVELLAEMVEAGNVKQYEVGGKKYGAVRNFCRFQRPKKPNSVHPQTVEIRNWVSVEARQCESGSEQVPHQFRTNGEIPPQMEDGGGNRIDASSIEEVSAEPTVPSENEEIIPEKPELKPEHVVEAWNDVAGRHGLPTIRKLTETRQKHLRTFIRNNTVDEVRIALDAIERSAFLRGENDRGWRADFDFLLQPKSFAKLIEGAYDH